MTSINISSLTSDQKKALAATMYNPVKIDAYLPSKIHNDIIRKANPTSSEEELAKKGSLKNELQYTKAVELEKLCKYQTTQIEMNDCKDFIKNYKTKCISGLNDFGLNDFNAQLIYNRGSSLEDSVKKATENVIYFIEQQLQNNE